VADLDGDLATLGHDRSALGVDDRVAVDVAELVGGSVAETG
jgi:hypothetical protein